MALSRMARPKGGESYAQDFARISVVHLCGFAGSPAGIKAAAILSWQRCQQPLRRPSNLAGQPKVVPDLETALTRLNNLTAEQAGANRDCGQN